MAVELAQFGAETFGYLWILLVADSSKAEAAIAELPVIPSLTTAVAEARTTAPGAEAEAIRQRERIEEHRRSTAKGIHIHFRRPQALRPPFRVSTLCVSLKRVTRSAPGRRAPCT